MKLRELLNQIPSIKSYNEHPSLDLEIKGLSTNSKTIEKGDLFIGIPGTRVDGGEFWESAIANGAIASLITPQAMAKVPPTSQCIIEVPNIIEVSADVANVFYNYPTQKLKMVGITGTNGKTTTTHLIEFFLTEMDKATALLGTLYTRWKGYEKTALNTTPFAVELQTQLFEALKAGNQYCTMEVSSHGLDQGRVLGCQFEVAVFTNLTQDHLDYHSTMEDYFQAKALLFSPQYLKGKAIINLDDDYGKRLLQQCENTWSYSVNDTSADFYTSNLTYEATGVKGTIHTPQGKAEFISPLVGQFNLSNLLAAVATGVYLGLDLKTLMEKLPNFVGVPGRMERVQASENQDITVIVDYAHTPDSLENLLKASRPFISGKMICVFGCGGDRDRTKRPLMGKIAAKLSDIAVVTSDNPRTEDPQQILKDVVEGIPSNIKHLVISDRSDAINTAIETAKSGDGVLIAGKGHEDYQILGTTKIHFDDREEAKKALLKTYSI